MVEFSVYISCPVVIAIHGVDAETHVQSLVWRHSGSNVRNTRGLEWCEETHDTDIATWNENTQNGNSY